MIKNLFKNALLITVILYIFLTKSIFLTTNIISQAFIVNFIDLALDVMIYNI